MIKIQPNLLKAGTDRSIMSHITVERNRRRQMNDHLKVLRTLTPSFYNKKGDQASIIGGAIEFIKELHHVLQSLESQKRRKSLSPSPSPRQAISNINTANAITTINPFLIDLNCNTPHGPKELVACCNSPVADVEAKISGPNVILRTISRRISGQLLKIICLLERNEFEILYLNISSMDDTVLYSFVVKIGFGCQLSMEELALDVQRSFNDDIVRSANDILIHV